MCTGKERKPSRLSEVKDRKIIGKCVISIDSFRQGVKRHRISKYFDIRKNILISVTTEFLYSSGKELYFFHFSFVMLL